MPKQKQTPAEKLLGGFPWPIELQTETPYRRLHDDHDGEYVGTISVGFSDDGDAWVGINNPKGGMLRFRSGFGGSHSPRVYSALVLLALAIKLDGDERPDPKPEIKTGPAEP